LESTDFELYRPEEITTWQDGAIFKNLVDLELELAAICSLVVIILESPGSIAELGAFSQLSELREKLLVIKSSTFNEEKNKNSFISLGILRHLKETNPQSVKTFPWDLESPRNIDVATIQDVLSGIGESLSKTGSTQVLSNKYETHSTTLVCELIRNFIALKLFEIVKFLDAFGFVLNADQVKRKLYLLEKFQLVKSVEYGGAEYYFRTKHKYNKLRWGAIKGKRLDDVKIILDCAAYYKNNKDRHRLGAIKDFTSGNNL